MNAGVPAAPSHRVRVTSRVPLPAHRLWESMWRPDVLAQWWGPEARVQLSRRAEATLAPLPCAGAWTGWVKAVGSDEDFTRMVLFERSGDPAQRVTVRVWPTGSGRCRVRIVVEGADDPDAVVRFVQRRLNRLARWALGIRTRENTPRQAVVVIHGIGEQQPGETLKSFVDGLFPPQAVPPIVRRYKPDLIDDTFELRRVRIDARGSGYPRTDVYELYWAHLMTGSALSDVTGWATGLLLRSPKRIPPALRGWWFVVWALIVAAVALAVAGMTGLLAALPAWILGVGAAVAAVWEAIKGPILGKGVDFVGDAARYLSPTPRNIGRRQAIRMAGVRLIEALHDSGDYDRIVLFGHSLGSVVAYDIITIAWLRFHRRNRSPRTTSSDALRHLEGVIRTSAPAPEDMAALQDAAWREHRRNTQPWLITDLVTAGSPLTHAELLLTTRKDPEIDSLVTERVMPADPPAGEEVEGVRHIAWNLPYVDVVADRRHKMLIPDHASPFAVTRWTNLYFETHGLRGDPVGGVIPPLFGASVRNVCLPVPPVPFWGGFVHGRYWVPLSPREKQRDPAAVDHTAELSAALALTCAGDLTAHNRTLPAHLLSRDE